MASLALLGITPFCSKAMNELSRNYITSSTTTFFFANLITLNHKYNMFCLDLSSVYLIEVERSNLANSDNKIFKKIVLPIYE